MTAHPASATTKPAARLAPRETLLGHAQRSPAAVAAKDKRAWLALFEDGARIEDPVGTPACRKGAHTLGPAGGPDDLERFYDCFIAPNSIRFDVHRDVVTADAVVRDVTIHMTGLAGVPTAIPAFLVYTMTGSPDAVRIEHMEAYWQSADVMRKVRSAGVRGVAAMAINTFQLVRSFGLAGTRAYMRGVQSRARSSVAKEAVHAWASDQRGVTVGKIITCGWSAACSVQLRDDDGERHGVAVFELERGSASVRDVRLHWDVD